MWTAILSLATSIATLVNTEVAKASADQIAALKIQRLDETSKGALADDTKIEYLDQLINIEVGKLQNELTLYAATGSGTKAPATAPVVA